MNRRTFVKTAALGGAVSAVLPQTGLLAEPLSRPDAKNTPVIVHTWDFKLPVIKKGLNVFEYGGRALDVVEQSIGVVEEDPSVTSVGRGGFPDRDGHLTLDACIMDSNGNAGSVMALEHIMHPISVARRVMEKTPHVILVGEGALQFAIEQGFPKEELLTDGAKKDRKSTRLNSSHRT